MRLWGESSANGLATVLGMKEKYPNVQTVSSSNIFIAGPSASSPKEALQPDLRALEFPHHSCDVDLAVLHRSCAANWAWQGYEANMPRA